MSYLHILILAIVQGAAELLPVSSSAHVIVAEKLLGLDPTSPEMTLLLVMLHTGTMFAVIVYFWSVWRSQYFSSAANFGQQGLRIVVATVLTAAVGLGMQAALKHVLARQNPGFEIEQLFGNAKLMAGALAAAGALIVVSARLPEGRQSQLSLSQAAMVGAVQGLCLPFRGFSRSGATISTGLAMGVARRRAEEFSFALAVVLTPAVLGKEAMRLHKAVAANHASTDMLALMTPGLVGMVLSFLAGLLALRWLSSWLEQGRWLWFGLYCWLAAGVVLLVG